MRGTRGDHERPDGCEGIIPADAGNTSSASMVMNVLKDHPRGCGEHLRAACLEESPAGSSPRMRGTRRDKRRKRDRFRIIPADAGNTARCHACEGQGRDHPRGCGEHPRVRVERCGDEGSSPRMRGTPSCSVIFTNLVGIIPADAGNTHSLRKT